MKFREGYNGAVYESKAEYFEHRVFDSSRFCDGELETLAARIDYLEQVIGRIIQHLPLDLEQLSEIVNGYDRDLQEIDQ